MLPFSVAITSYLLFFSLMIYIFLIADPEKSPFAQFLFGKLPQKLHDLSQKVIGANTTAKIAKLHHFAYHERNPIMLLFYLILVLGTWTVIFWYAYPHIPSACLSGYHRYAGYVTFVLCAFSFWKATKTPPGYIVKGNMAKFDHYPYDELMFASGKICPTANIRKLARSKYCRYSNRHVARFDHYCGWLDNTIGEENYRWFLFFLGVHIFMSCYGTVVTFLILKGIVIDKNLMSSKFMNVATGEEVEATRIVVWHYLMNRHFWLCSVFLLMSVMSILLSAFFMFHMYIIKNGMTTNEYYKWKHVARWHKRATENYLKKLKKGKETGVNIVDTAATGNGDHRDELSSSDTAKATNGLDLLEDMDVGCTSTNIDTKEIMTGVTHTSKMKEDKPTNKTAPTVVSNPGKFPKNKYNLGIVQNFNEVLFPRSLQLDALQRWHADFFKQKMAATNEKNQ